MSTSRMIEVLLKAGNNLSLAAQTTGGTAGRDEGLVAAIDGWVKARDAFIAIKRMERLEPEGTVVGVVGGAVPLTE